MAPKDYRKDRPSRSSITGRKNAGQFINKSTLTSLWNFEIFVCFCLLLFVLKNFEKIDPLVVEVNLLLRLAGSRSKSTNTTAEKKKSKFYTGNFFCESFVVEVDLLLLLSFSASAGLKSQNFFIFSHYL